MNFVFAVAMGAVVHLGAMAVAAEAFKVAVHQVVIGWGPALFSFGRWTLKLLPFGGFVKVRDTRDEPPHEWQELAPADAINGRSRTVQAAILLSGPVALVLLAVAVRGADGLWSTAAGFTQILRGALDHDYAHELFDKLGETAQHGLLPVFAITAAKIAAFNLLPLPALNGGQALIAFVCGPSLTRPPWLVRLQTLGVWLTIFLGLLWLVAVVTYVAV